MELLEKNKYYILPQPKYIDISKENGITLSSLLTMFISKHKIKDNALLLSSKFNKHFNTFLNTIPIRDSTLNEKLGENYYFTIITTESNYERQINQSLNEFLETHISQFKEILHNCCYELFPDILKSSLSLREAYYIDISDGSIWILSQSIRGFYFGIQSLVQLIEHTLFLYDELDEFIILPKMRIVDFSGWRIRAFSVNLNFFKPTINALRDVIPFLAKYKINSLILYPESEFSYSADDRKTIQDSCKFHHIDLSVSTDFETISDKRIHAVQYSTNSRFILLDYLSIFKKITEINLKQNLSGEGVLVSSSQNEFYPLDLILFAVPIIAELLWNPQNPYSQNRLKFLSEATQLNLFENNIITQSVDLANIFQSSSIDNKNISLVYVILEQARKYTFENAQIIEILEWAFRLLGLERSLYEINKSILSKDKPKIIPNELKKRFQQLSDDFFYLKSLGLKILETSNHIGKGECEKFFANSGYTLKSLVESWIPEITRE